MSKILIADRMSPIASQIFENMGLNVEVNVGLSVESLGAIIKSYDGLVVRSATKVTADLIAKANKLKVIGRAGIGVDNIDLESATARGIVVMNTPYGNSITTAEHAIALMTSLARQIPLADRSTREGKWEKNRFMGVELYNKVLGIIGCGNIGSIVATRALGLKMRVVTYDPYLSPESAKNIGVERVSLDKLLQCSDFVTLHMPLNSETTGILNQESLTSMKQGAYIINCARGGLIVESDLKDAIDSGHIAGAALDVFEIEPATDNPLFNLNQVIATPHLGAATEEAQENVARQVAEQISEYLLHGGVTNAVNTPSIASEDVAKLEPYLRLAGQLGSFAGQVTETSLLRVTIEYEGAASRLNCQPLTAILLQALLLPLLDSVNAVNAPLIARQRGIDVREVKREHAENYQTLIRLTVSTERQERSIAGTVFAGDKPRIVEIKGIKIEAELSNNMLYFTNKDKPGFIGGVGQILGNAGMNIATFHLGRSSTGGDAIGLVSTDSEADEGLLTKLKNLPSIVQVRRLKF